MPLESLSISKKERERKDKTEDESDSADRLNNHLPPELYTEEPSCNSYMTDGEALDSAAEDEDQIRWVGSARFVVGLRSFSFLDDQHSYRASFG
jgi:hypothetical protein